MNDGMGDDNESTERNLVRRAQCGDDRALASLLERHGQPLRRRIQGSLSPAVRRKLSASDVLQETLLVASRRLHAFEYRGQGSFGAWLGQIADHAARKAARRFEGTAKRGTSREVTGDPRRRTAEPADLAVSPGAQVQGQELRAQIAKALEELPEDHRTVIGLLQDRRMTIAEAASVMGRTENAIKKLHARALDAMARRLGLTARASDGAE